ncbi:hypothetical protein JTB14_033258 [Gonioctena quinquepunctata]|nr:hypothetical protein JTB14_033258 [Gonioctena quinquepunctata]
MKYIYVVRKFFLRKVKKGNIYGMQKGSIKIIKWTDKKYVCMLPTREYHNDTLIDTAKVRNGKPVQKSKCVVDYNKAKKRVDYSDQMSSYQNVLRKGMKWYRKVAMEIIFGAAMTNAWIPHNAKFTEKQLSILDFKDMVCKGLFEHSCESEIPRPRTPKRIHTITEGGPGAKKRRKCKGCYQILRKSMESRAADKVKEVYTFCMECDGNSGYCPPFFNQAHAAQAGQAP